MKGSSIIWDLNPLISVGPVQFGTLITPFIKEYLLQKIELYPVEGLDWDTYVFPDCESTLHVENSHIVSVGCYDNFFYKERNLLGLTFEEIQEILGPEDEIGEQIGEKIPVEYEKLGVEVWLRDEIVADITCYGAFPEDY